MFTSLNPYYSYPFGTVINEDGVILYYADNIESVAGEYKCVVCQYKLC